MKDVEFAHSAFTTADRYERGRSGYPDEAVAWLTRVLEVDSDSTVVDLAAGTGKLTRLLVPAAGRVVAVEPVTAMRGELARVVRGARVVAGTAEAIPLADSSAHALTVAQAFHWFDPARALPEMHRVLCPGGHVGLVWNRADTSVPWVARLDELRSPNKSRGGGGLDPAGVATEARRLLRSAIHTAATVRDSWRGRGRPGRGGVEISGPSGAKSDPWWVARCRDGFASSSLFTPLESRIFRHAERMDVDRLVDWVASFSRFSRLSPGQQDSVTARVRDLARDELSVEFDFPYRTDVFWTARR